MRHSSLSARHCAMCCSLLLLPLLAASPLQARLSLTDVNNRVLDLEKADQDALGGQLIVDAVSIENGSPGAGVVIVGVNFDNGATPIVTLGGAALAAVSVSLDGETLDPVELVQRVHRRIRSAVRCHARNDHPGRRWNLPS